MTTLDVADRQWVITAYTVAFGALHLLGGRIGADLGRRRTFLVPVVAFGVASARCSACPCA